MRGSNQRRVVALEVRVLVLSLILSLLQSHLDLQYLVLQHTPIVYAWSVRFYSRRHVHCLMLVNLLIHCRHGGGIF